MYGKFWSNSIWYIILVLTSIVIFIFTAIQSRKWKHTIASYFSIVGITFLIEWLILVIFRGYSYYPMMMKKAFDDSMMGNVISQTSLSSSALLIAINDLHYIWFIIFSTIYSLIEVLFLKLGIYEHHWYKTWYSLFGLIFYFLISKKWYEKITTFPSHFTQHIALFLSVFAVYSPCIEWPLRILGIYLFKVNLFSDPIRNHVNDYVIYIFFILNIFVILYKSNLGFLWKALTTASIFFINYILVKLNILYIKPNWFFIYSTILILSNYLLIIFFDRMFDFRNKNQNL